MKSRPAQIVCQCCVSYAAFFFLNPYFIQMLFEVLAFPFCSNARCSDQCRHVPL